MSASLRIQPRRDEEPWLAQAEYVVAARGSVRGAAEVIGAHPRTVYSWLSGEHIPATRHRIAIAEAYDKCRVGEAKTSAAERAHEAENCRLYALMAALEAARAVQRTTSLAAAHQVAQDLRQRIIPLMP